MQCVCKMAETQWDEPSFLDENVKEVEPPRQAGHEGTCRPAVVIRSAAGDGTAAEATWAVSISPLVV